MAKVKMLAAVALLDIPSAGVKAGQILEAAASVIAPLKAAGEVDDNKGALDYARKQRSAIVRLEPEQSADADGAAGQALADAQAAVDRLQAQLSAAGSAEQPAIEQQLSAARAALEALQ